ncbi:hypothetical protein [Saccharopolyspora endophytica]|uniref:MOSC domain-containing protein n=1 Tax=Saccharopolyspora endophytica TaxID=543886 RepID=A0ABS5DAS8_9PSEU|nr:hypothetical protein [Saccharopolyspora endophytica]MBQ0923409.1 hypothetical protein [Saccharopolyspora endophytica]
MSRSSCGRRKPGAYLRVIEPGDVRPGDSVEVAHRPDHRATVALAFRALTLEPALLQSIPRSVREALG